MGLLRWRDESDGTEGERRETKEEKEECKRTSWSCSAEASRSAEASQPPYYQLWIELAAIKPVFYRRTYQIFSQDLYDGVCVTVGGTMDPDCLSYLYRLLRAAGLWSVQSSAVLDVNNFAFRFFGVSFFFFFFVNLYPISLLLAS